MADLTLDDILATSEAEQTEVASLIALTTGLKTQLDQALVGEPISPAGTAKMNKIFANLQAQKDEIAAAILANTPSSTTTGGTGVTSTLVTSGTNPAPIGTSVVLFATVSQSAPATPEVPATGTVAFMDGTASIGTGTLDAMGTASVTTTFAAPAGDHAITAVYSGDAANAGSTSGVLTQTVT